METGRCSDATGSGDYNPRSQSAEILGRSGTVECLDEALEAGAGVLEESSVVFSEASAAARPQDTVGVSTDGAVSCQRRGSLVAAPEDASGTTIDSTPTLDRCHSCSDTGRGGNAPQIGEPPLRFSPRRPAMNVPDEGRCCDAIIPTGFIPATVLSGTIPAVSQLSSGVWRRLSDDSGPPVLARVRAMPPSDASSFDTEMLYYLGHIMSARQSLRRSVSKRLFYMQQRQQMEQQQEQMYEQRLQQPQVERQRSDQVPGIGNGSTREGSRKRLRVWPCWAEPAPPQYDNARAAGTAESSVARGDGRSLPPSSLLLRRGGPRLHASAARRFRSRVGSPTTQSQSGAKTIEAEPRSPRRGGGFLNGVFWFGGIPSPPQRLLQTPSDSAPASPGRERQNESSSNSTVVGCAPATTPLSTGGTKSPCSNDVGTAAELGTSSSGNSDFSPSGLGETAQLAYRSAAAGFRAPRGRHRRPYEQRLRRLNSASAAAALVAGGTRPTVVSSSSSVPLACGRPAQPARDDIGASGTPSRLAGGPPSTGLPRALQALARYAVMQLTLGRPSSADGLEGVGSLDPTPPPQRHSNREAELNRLASVVTEVVLHSLASWVLSHTSWPSGLLLPPLSSAPMEQPSCDLQSSVARADGPRAAEQLRRDAPSCDPPLSSTEPPASRKPSASGTAATRRGIVESTAAQIIKFQKDSRPSPAFEQRQSIPRGSIGQRYEYWETFSADGLLASLTSITGLLRLRALLRNPRAAELAAEVSGLLRLEGLVMNYSRHEELLLPFLQLAPTLTWQALQSPLCTVMPDFLVPRILVTSICSSSAPSLEPLRGQLVTLMGISALMSATSFTKLALSSPALVARMLGLPPPGAGNDPYFGNTGCDSFAADATEPGVGGSALHANSAHGAFSFRISLLHFAAASNRPNLVTFLVKQCHAGVDEPIETIPAAGATCVQPTSYLAKGSKGAGGTTGRPTSKSRRPESRSAPVAQRAFQKRGRAPPSNVPQLRWTALILAAQRNHAATVHTLIQLGADVNFRDGLGLTVLAHAVLNYSTLAALQLLLAGASVNDLEASSKLNLHDLAKIVQDPEVDLLGRYITAAVRSDALALKRIDLDEPTPYEKEAADTLEGKHTERPIAESITPATMTTTFVAQFAPSWLLVNSRAVVTSFYRGHAAVTRALARTRCRIREIFSLDCRHLGPAIVILAYSISYYSLCIEIPRFIRDQHSQLELLAVVDRINLDYWSCGAMTLLGLLLFYFLFWSRPARTLPILGHTVFEDIQRTLELPNSVSLLGQQEFPFFFKSDGASVEDQRRLALDARQKLRNKIDLAGVCFRCCNRFPLRAVHCRKCKACIVMKEHHCVLFQRCIDKSNRGSYVLLLVVVLFLQAVHTIWCLYIFTAFSSFHDEEWSKTHAVESGNSFRAVVAAIRAAISAISAISNVHIGSFCATFLTICFNAATILHILGLLMEHYSNLRRNVTKLELSRLPVHSLWQRQEILGEGTGSLEPAVTGSARATTSSSSKTPEKKESKLL